MNIWIICLIPVINQIFNNTGLSYNIDLVYMFDTSISCKPNQLLSISYILHMKLKLSHIPDIRPFRTNCAAVTTLTCVNHGVNHGKNSSTSCNSSTNSSHNHGKSCHKCYHCRHKDLQHSTKKDCYKSNIFKIPA